ncbi:hypothetical protein [Yersinia intermedia]|jgi:hypothetical protein|uniref:hypothetical protein n=1 Tax=Yersinia intermedia TaxID=631 RepID=UPI0005E58010|nr:hypothetical protein [Yersinia intermedia]WET14222.1 hypothetical protein P2W49_17055 [Yersinia intermedia]CNB42360.1 Uncharacterised protein [Yersinia intermedia]CNC52160.1 Uncharacterised protein [Yersinia intermedia]CNG57608.1 Uncharacterised protein [Yersinia intermedia]CNH24231.1 Uncharacterised protein [Yersinia intermedia]
MGAYPLMVAAEGEGPPEGVPFTPLLIVSLFIAPLFDYFPHLFPSKSPELPLKNAQFLRSINIVSMHIIIYCIVMIATILLTF